MLYLGPCGTSLTHSKRNTLIIAPYISLDGGLEYDLFSLIALFEVLPTDALYSRQLQVVFLMIGHMKVFVPLMDSQSFFFQQNDLFLQLPDIAAAHAISDGKRLGVPIIFELPYNPR